MLEVMRRACWWIAVSLLFAGCADEPLPVDQLSLDAARARSRDAHCERPLLGGEPIEGRADEAMMALIDPEGPAGACFAAVQKNVGRTRRQRPPKGALWADPAPYDEHLTAIASACESAPALVGTAIRHRDACSPLRAGAHDGTDEIHLEIISLARGVDARAAQLAATGDAAAAVRALLDGIRLMHDFRRGTVSMHAVTLASPGESMLLGRLEVLLAEHPLPREVLDEVATRLEVLWQTRPHAADVIEGEQIATTDLLDDEKLEVLWDVHTLAAEYRQLEEACPAGATVAACQRGLAALEQSVLARLFVMTTAVDYRLAGLRIHVATLQSAGCDPSTVAPALLSPPELGETIDVRGSDLTIPYRKHLVRAKSGPIAVWRVRCPAGP